MIHLASPWEGVKILVIGFVFGYLWARFLHRKPKTFEFTNLRFGDLGEKKGIKL